MTALTLAIDNDIVIKLAQMDVYRDGLSAIGVSPEQAGSTQTMLNYLTAAAHGTKLKLPSQEQDRLKSAIHTLTDLVMTDGRGGLWTSKVPSTPPHFENS